MTNEDRKLLATILTLLGILCLLVLTHSCASDNALELRIEKLEPPKDEGD